MKLLALLIALLFFAVAPGGAAAQAPPAVPAAAPASPLKQMIARANQEWRRFGGQVVLLDRLFIASWPLLRPGQKTAEQRRCAEIRDRFWAPVTGKAADSESKPGREGAPICDVAWSAVFISALVKEAGVSPVDFQFSDTHAIYVRHIIRRYREATEKGDPAPPFIPHNVEDRTPARGDLICATRRGENERVLRVFYDFNEFMFSDAMASHCDLVVVVNMRARRLHAIGGNVRDSVSLSVVALDEHGRLVRTLDRPWYVVIENRLP